MFPWGDELEPGGDHAMNVFQGTFPAATPAADGYTGTAPVDTFEAERLRRVQHDRQRVGVVRGLVLAGVLPAQRQA